MAFGKTSRGLIEIMLQPRHYAVFAHDGHVSRIGATYDAIWNDWFPSSGERAANAPFERQRTTFNRQTGMGR